MKVRPDLLLVDDDPSVLHALNRILKGHANVRSTTSGQTAISLIEQSPVDLLMLDIDMPDMDGFEVLSHLKRSKHLDQFPVVVLSGKTEPGLEARVLESGAADYLSKPFTPSHVLARVRAQLQLRRNRLRTHRLLEAAHSDKSLSILIVDDDPRALHATRKALMPLEGEVRFALSAGDAMAALEDTLPDLVILDIQLPDASGFDLCNAMRDDPLLSRVPVVILTRFDDEASEAKACDLGAMDFVPKSCSPTLLLARVRKVLRLKAESDALVAALNRHWQKVSESRTSLIMDASSDGMLSVDAEARVVLINRAACSLLGVRHEAVMHRPLADLMTGRSGWEPLQAKLMSLAQGAESGDAAESLLLTLQAPNGEERHIEPRLSQIEDNGSCLATVTLRDVTDRELANRLAHEQIRSNADREARALTMSCVVHELGNPLNAILGFAQLMLKDQRQPMPDVHRQNVQNLLDAAGTLQTLMHDLRDVSLLEQGRFKVNNQRTNLLGAVDAAVAGVGAAAAQSGVTVHWSRPADPVWVIADADRVKQCMTNLLTNAIKYNRPGGRVEVSVERGSVHADINVSDTGQGMQPAQLESLFHPFERLGQERSAIPGTGLGLSVSRMLAHAMGGDLTATSLPGVGSTFRLSLCAAEPSAAS